MAQTWIFGITIRDCDLDLGDMNLVKVMTHPLVMDNNFVKYYPDPTWQ